MTHGVTRGTPSADVGAILLLDLCERLEAGDQAAMLEAVRGLPEIPTELLRQTQAEAMK